jgi:hypothetical protein
MMNETAILVSSGAGIGRRSLGERMDFAKHLLKRFESPDGRRWLDIYKRFDGLFCFQEFSEGPPKTELRGDSNISPGMESAAYDSAEAAEADARKRIPWLRDISN